MNWRKRIAYLLMMIVIWKHLISGKFGPFDRFVELGVFVLIAYEVIVNLRRRRNESKRQKALADIVAVLVEFIEKGRQLQRTVPDPNKNPSTVLSWINSVELWTHEVNEFLTQRSSKASAAFDLVAETVQQANPIYVRTKSGLSFPIGDGPQREAYLQLIVQLNNLRNISEKPDAYFREG